MIENRVENYCVRVRCNGHTGSGVLLSGPDTFYILTAAHCLGKIEPNLQEIKIERQTDYMSQFSELDCIRVVEFNLEHDFALIEVDFKDAATQPGYKLARGIFSENTVRFCGYQGINVDQYRPFDCIIKGVSEASGRFKISLSNETFDQAGEDGLHIAQGLSGSGVFIFRHNSPFLIGILNSVIEEKAWNDDIDCCSIKHLEKYISEYVDLSDFENLKKWNENLEKSRNEREIELFKKDNTDFFNILYRKNKVLYTDIDKCNSVTAKQIRKFLAMKDNIKTMENDYPLLYTNFKNTVKRFVDTVEDDYSRNVSESNEAINLKMELQTKLQLALNTLPQYTNIDLSEFQVIEWLGICTLNFTSND